MDWLKDLWVSGKALTNEIRNEKRLNRNLELETELKKQQIANEKSRNIRVGEQSLNPKMVLAGAGALLLAVIFLIKR